MYGSAYSLYASNISAIFFVMENASQEITIYSCNINLKKLYTLTIGPHLTSLLSTMMTFKSLYIHVHVCISHKVLEYEFYIYTILYWNMVIS